MDGEELFTSADDLLRVLVTEFKVCSFKLFSLLLNQFISLFCPKQKLAGHLWRRGGWLDCSLSVGMICFPWRVRLSVVGSIPHCGKAVETLCSKLR